MQWFLQFDARNRTLAVGFQARHHNRRTTVLGPAELKVLEAARFIDNGRTGRLYEKYLSITADEQLALSFTNLHALNIKIITHLRSNLIQTCRIHDTL